MSAELPYTFRARVPVTLCRGRVQTSQLVISYDGQAVSPLAGDYTLLSPGGVVYTTQPIELINGTASAHLDLPATLEPLGSGWQERWSVDLPDGTRRAIRRSAALALFELHPPVAQDDLLRDYPDLLAALGDYASTLQVWIDSAFEDVRRALWGHGDWPHIIVEPADVYAVTRDGALYRLFRSLYRGGGDSERWRELWSAHESDYRNGLAGLSITVDRDNDGVADHDGREATAIARIDWHVPQVSDPRNLSKKFR